MRKFYLFILLALLSITSNAFGVEFSSPEIQQLYTTSENYHTESQFEKALEYLDLALIKAEERNNKSDIATILSTMATVPLAHFLLTVYFSPMKRNRLVLSTRD